MRQFMSKLIGTVALALIVVVGADALAGDTSVRGYTRQDGTYVQPYHRTTPDHNPYNNYSTQGNVNPYTGQPGTRDPEAVMRSYRGNDSNNSLYGTSPQQRQNTPSWLK